jgi:predicted dehydrogenase
MRLAIVGCGYVADFYMKTLPLHPELEVVGVMDRDPARARHFAAHHGLRRYDSLDEVLRDDRVQTVLNLTNPHSHFEVVRAALEAGKHVYSEKPLTMSHEESRRLVELARERGLHLSGAPCSVLNPAAQTLWKAIREQQVGPIRLVHAEFDDGMVTRMAYRQWRSESGIPWPYHDEFEIGCTVEHAGYPLSWLVAFFGPVRTVHAFAAVLLPDKGTEQPLTADAPDYSVASLVFESGVVARLTCGLYAPRDHSLTCFGDDGVMTLADVSRDRAPVRIRRYIRIRRGLRLTPWRRTYPMVGKHLPRARYRGSQNRDFATGIAELGAAIGEGRPSRLAADYFLHVNEVVLAIHEARRNGGSVRLTTTCGPMEPMPYALVPPDRVRPSPRDVARPGGGSIRGHGHEAHDHGGGGVPRPVLGDRGASARP